MECYNFSRSTKMICMHIKSIIFFDYDCNNLNSTQVLGYISRYAYFKKLDYFSTECIYSPNAYRGHARSFIKDAEAVRPSSIIGMSDLGHNIGCASPFLKVSIGPHKNIITNKICFFQKFLPKWSKGMTRHFCVKLCFNLSLLFIVNEGLCLPDIIHSGESLSFKKEVKMPVQGKYAGCVIIPNNPSIHFVQLQALLLLSM